MWHTLSLEEIRHKLKTNFERGLNNNEVIRRQEMYVKNELAETKKTSVLVKFINQFKDFMIITLIIAAIISAGLSYVQASNEYIDSIIIIAIGRDTTIPQKPPNIPPAKTAKIFTNGCNLLVFP